MTEKMSDNKQKQLIHIMKAELIKKGELDEAGYRAMLGRNYDVDSSKDLTWPQASKFIDDLKALGAKIQHSKSKIQNRRPSAPNVTQLMSRQQLVMIEHLKADILWTAGPMGYYKWLQKYLKKDHITTSKEAQNVIEALKAMVKRQEPRENNSQEYHDYPSVQGGKIREC